MKWHFQILTAVALGLALLASYAVVVDDGDCAELKNVVKFAVGANGAWFDGPAVAFPNDVELGGNARASLSPHLSAVGAAYYGFNHSYVRWSAGARVTATDVDNRNFSVGIGVQYHGGSEAELLPEEWAPDASFGWRPAPETLSRLLVVGQGSYGLTSGKARAILGLRHELPF